VAGCDGVCEAALRGLVIDGDGDGVEVEPKRVRRFLAAALSHGSTRSQIFLDAARVYLRLGEVDQVLSMLWKARAHNAHREVAAVLDESAFAGRSIARPRSCPPSWGGPAWSSRFET
jgi:hypothetical protein